MYSYCCFTQSVTFSGQILGEEGNPLPYAGVMVTDLSTGTLSDESGKFLIRLPQKGEYAFVFQYLGYKDLYDTLTLMADVSRNYQMQKEDLSTEEVIITSDGKDPAYGIIAKAIERKPLNASPFQEYQYASYSKTVIGLPKSFSADSIFGSSKRGALGTKSKKKKKTDTEMESPLPPELSSKILYLSETMSDVFVKEPEKAKENIYSSRVSGDSKSFSLFGNLITRFNPYENRLVMEGVADRGIILPLADNAFFYYDFKLSGVKKEKGVKYYKIQVLPKREFDPVCKGVIYITDSLYAIREIDITVTKRQNITMMDTLSLRQQYSEHAGKYLPYAMRMGFDFVFDLGLIKIPLEGFSVSLLSEYNVSPNTSEKKRFGNEVIAVSDSALGKPKVYWDYHRPLPLTPEEEYDFRLKDSLEQVKNSPRYKDSVQRANNKFDFAQWLSLGETFKFYKQNLSIKVAPLLETVSFNPMEGWILKPDLHFEKELERKRKLHTDFILRYGFSNRKFSWKTGITWENNPKYFSKWIAEVGDYPLQFSKFEQVDIYLHAIRCLSYKSNFMRLFQQRYIEFGYEREVFNGFSARVTTGAYRRSGLVNTSDFSFSKIKTPYDPNLILDNPLFPSQGFIQNDALITTLSLRYQPGTEYISVPWEKINMGSKYPEFTAEVTKAFGVFPQSADYLKARIMVSGKTPIGMLGVTSWNITTGGFLASKQVYFPDIWHFKGNQTAVRDNSVAQFSLMPYYYYSNTNPYLELHAEHAFHGFIFNKIPWVRRLKLEEYAGGHLLWTSRKPTPYIEVNFGIEKKLLKIIPIRIEFCLALSAGAYRKQAFMFTAPSIEGMPISTSM